MQQYQSCNKAEVNSYKTKSNFHLEQKIIESALSAKTTAGQNARDTKEPKVTEKINIITRKYNKMLKSTNKLRNQWLQNIH